MKSFLKTNKKNILVLIATYEVFFVLVLHLWPTFALKFATDNLNKPDISANDIANWHFAFLSFQNAKTNNNVEISNSIENYVAGLDEYNRHALFKFPELNITRINQIESKAVPETLITTNSNLPLGEKIVPKLENENSMTFQVIEINDQQLYFARNDMVNLSKQEVIVGTKNRVEFADDIKREVSNSLTTTPGISDRFILSEDDIGILQHSIIGGVLINTMSVEDKIVVGSLQIFQENCKTGQLLPIEYDTIENIFRLSEFGDGDNQDCSTFIEVDCEDCSFAPIDKSTRLPSTYVPNLVATNLPGGALLTKQTVEALTRLSQAMKSEGITLYVTSGYRSYAQQQVAYNSWVTSEVQKGSSLENAKIRANNYSALPGHSEHQLGTTVDVRCSGCDPFSKDLNNSPFYLYLYAHAHEYGFIISYPENKQTLTGYSFEPWHIRYIGVAMATELYNRGYLQDTNQEYLSKYLREKGLY